MTVITGVLDSVTFTTYHVFTTKQTGVLVIQASRDKTMLTASRRQLPLHRHLHIQ
jgi:uncharacterized membrane protein YoaK (UPF0700 family)